MVKSTITNEKTVNYEGIFDIKDSYAFLKSYLEDFKHYDVTEKEAEEKNKGGKREIKGNFTAELEYNDYYKFHITFELKFIGKSVVVENDSGAKNLIDGSANLFVNSYLETDYLQKRPKGPIAEFLDKVYNKYIENERQLAVKQLVIDTNEFIGRFKQTLNYSVK